ncbi:MAG: hypothetical protein IPK04_06415 [Bdellovibrionales bacterium]|nr:hypothetical protein [Bdellovibrionales bacterium]
MKSIIKQSARSCLSCVYHSYIVRVFRKLFSIKLTMFLQHQAIVSKWADAFQVEVEILLTKLVELEGGNTTVGRRYLSTQFWESSFFHGIAIRDLLAIAERRIPLNKVTSTMLKPGGNIVFVTSVFPSLNHGGGLRAFDLMHELSLLGYQVHLFSVKPDGDEFETQKGLKSFLASSAFVPSSGFLVSDFEEWIKSTKIDFDFGYFIWPQSVDLMEESTGQIKSKAFEYIEVTTRRVWMDIQTMFQEHSLKKMHQKVGEFLTNHHLEKKAALIADKLICLTEKDAEFVDKIFQ